jgi:hypothetical protein
VHGPGRPSINAHAAYDGDVTHEYVIGLGGIVASGTPGDPGASGPDDASPATAIAWAADRVLAVGSDADVRSISRGDSIFIDLAGCTVTMLPTETAPAALLLLRSGIRALDAAGLVDTLTDSGLLPAGATIEPGSPANLAFWVGEPARLLATVVAGAFTGGDEHHGPFYPA